jgi:uncharacterized protein
MRCLYCFYADVAETRETKSYGVMSLETLEQVVKQALSEATESCAFGFQGGEPTLAGLDFFRAFTTFEKKHNTRKIKTSRAIQTNGLLVDDEWAEFLVSNRFLVGLSIDADKPVHDALRLDTSHKGTHGRCLVAARILDKYRTEWNVLSVVTKELAAHPDKAYQFYAKHGMKYLQFIPCLEPLEKKDAPEKYAPSVKAYGKFICRLFDLWYNDFIAGHIVSIRAFDNYIQMLCGKPPENCAMSGHCTAYALVEADGSVYPCDFYALDEYRLGNIHTHSFEEMFISETLQNFISPSLIKHELCGGCEYFFICRGGCRREREPVTGGAPSINRYCGAYKIFFAHALPRMYKIAEVLAGKGRYSW